mmetsp:Transcript_17829/g.36532  ORF Transcript_17829/g.36532 Transcript_17829/m.36532 type:complete len:83 (-) Transcript_17829:104-352(-)
MLCLLGLDGRRAVADWGSRCGICNADRWDTLSAEDAQASVPEAVWRTHKNSPFFRCGHCTQVFWAGEKYDGAMDTLKDLALN